MIGSSGNVLAKRLVFAALCVSAVFSLIATGAQLILAYNRDVERVWESTIALEKHFEKSLATALWEFNFRQVKVILDSIRASDDVARVALTTTTGQDFAVGRPDPEENLGHRAFQIFRSEPGREPQLLGTLRLDITLRQIHARLWNQASTMLATNLAKSLLASLCIIFVFNRMVSVHLRKIAEFVREEDRWRRPEKLALDRPARRRRDDLDLVAWAINDAQDRLRGSYRELAQTNRQLSKANATLSKSNLELERFANIASHDLQEPTRMVASFTDLLRSKYQGQLDEQGLRYLQFVHDGSLRLNTMIAGLREYSRISQDATQRENLCAEEALSLAIGKVKATRGLGEAIIEHDELPALHANRKQLVTLFRNLIDNALKFQASNAVARIRVETTRLDDEWRFSIADNGIGISRKHDEDIFLIFKQLNHRDAFDGIGLGLAICQRIVQAHGGRIWIEPNPDDGGSRFFFTLPAIRDPAATATEVEATPVPLPAA